MTIRFRESIKPFDHYTKQEQERKKDILKAIPSEMQAEKILYDTGFIIGTQDRADLTGILDYYNDTDITFHEKSRTERYKTYNAFVSVKSHDNKNFRNLFLETFDKQGKPSWAYGGEDGTAFFDPKKDNRFFMVVQDNYKSTSFHEKADQIIKQNREKTCADIAREIIDYYSQDQEQLLNHPAILYRYTDIADALSRKAEQDGKAWNDITQWDIKARTGKWCFAYFWDEEARASQNIQTPFNDWDQRYGRAIYYYQDGKLIVDQRNISKPVTFQTARYDLTGKIIETEDGNKIYFTPEDRAEYREQKLAKAERRQRDGLTAEEYFNTLYWEILEKRTPEEIERDIDLELAELKRESSDPERKRETLADQERK